MWEIGTISNSISDSPESTITTNPHQRKEVVYKPHAPHPPPPPAVTGGSSPASSGTVPPSCGRCPLWSCPQWPAPFAQLAVFHGQHVFDIHEGRFSLMLVKSFLVQTSRRTPQGYLQVWWHVPPWPGPCISPPTLHFLFRHAASRKADSSGDGILMLMRPGDLQRLLT